MTIYHVRVFMKTSVTIQGCRNVKKLNGDKNFVFGVIILPPRIEIESICQILVGTSSPPPQVPLSSGGPTTAGPAENHSFLRDMSFG